ncbi:MAG: enoyl-CoA hydratase [Candidatus Dadabacteria bacterium]|nr:enoyl-CoA hydratase [Candidatus Dadabacteria bacterium]NIS07462.1 enoyl-CoA hydratase [Candidatus Dadabacteria bacterium]NIV42447.1 enoyl-CoA hydratase [Candidatus Dadabacteria bacterium]NIY21106.1 enoyl-CoA hydratase [Candidatus Dadabacteria bacterium]
MSEDNGLIIENRDLVSIITINRPEKRNVVTPSMLGGIRNTLAELEKAGNTRCVVIRGQGNKAFSSGYDINAIGENDMVNNQNGTNPLPMCAKSIEDFPYPVIAMINGHAFGAGLEIAVSCDYRVCSEKAKLGMPPAKLGVLYSYAGIRKFLNLIGAGFTKEMFLIGNPVDAAKAEKIGLVNTVKSSEEIEEYALKLAEEISQNAPLSMKTMKFMINKWQENQNLSDEQENELVNMILEVQNSSDYKEGQKAFSEKRKPVYKGK